jgi:hypothetical protein
MNTAAWATSWPVRSSSSSTSGTLYSSPDCAVQWAGGGFEEPPEPTPPASEGGASSS